MTYTDALAEARKVGASHAEGDSLLALAVLVTAFPHPGLNPSLVFEGARKRSLTAHELSHFEVMALNDLMFEGMGV